MQTSAKKNSKAEGTRSPALNAWDCFKEYGLDSK
jgi:hypothetical protein